MGKIVDLSRRISETVQDKVQVAIDYTNRHMYTGFRLVPQSMTLNDLCRARFKVIDS